jgi:oligoribonuclease
MPDPSSTRRTELHRHRERGRTDRDDLYAVLDAGLICHLGVITDGVPRVLPTGSRRTSVSGAGETEGPFGKRSLTGNARESRPYPVRVNDRLVWIDCEMTGLDIERDALIEIACLVTDSELNLLDEGVDLVIKPPAEALAGMPDVVRDMHTASGLLAELPSGIPVAEAAERVLGYVRGHVTEPRRVPLCGNSIATDRWFIARDMPELDAYLHYRMIDVSSIKELVRRWFPRAYFASPAKHGGHRALADIKESVQELRYYREAVFVPKPGPDSATAREIAARYTQPVQEGAAGAPDS